MVDAQVRWTSYALAMVAVHAPQGLSSLCSRDQAYWMTRRQLVFFRCLRRGVRRPPGDEAVRPLPGCATSAAYSAQVSYHLLVLITFRYKYSVANNLCFIYPRWTRKGVPAVTSFVDRLQSYMAEWAFAAHEQNIVIEHRLHDGASWVAYLQWYLPRTRTRVTYVPATPPPPPVPDHNRILPDATYPVRRDQTADTAVRYNTANILHSYDFSL
jgi:hypothetical protein